MYRKRRNVERQVALFLIGVLMFVPPLLVVFDRAARVGGIPVLYLYLFGAWTALIALTAAMSRSFEDDDGSTRRTDGADGEPPVRPTAETAPDA